MSLVHVVANDANIDQLVEEILGSGVITMDSVREVADRLEPSDRIRYLNSLLALENMRLKYANLFGDGVPDQIHQLINQSSEESKQEKVQFYTDELTGVQTRKYMIKRDSESKGMYAVLMMDLDKFKRWNDEYGHDVGDIALRVLGNILIENVRSTEGYIARYGGEEFYIELNQIGANDALRVAERIRENVEKMGMQKVNAELERVGLEGVYNKMKANGLSMTISIGVAEETQGKRPEEARKRADIALFNAKENGRNQVVKYTDGMQIPISVN